MAKFATREEWLEAAVEELAPLVEMETGTFPRPRVSTGFGPLAAMSSLGWCVPLELAEDGRPQIFISPVLKSKKAADAEEGVLATLLHELCHAALPVKVGHGKPFQKLAEAVGLVGPWTATSAGDALVPTLEKIYKRLGPYPHAAIQFQDRKKQTTRMRKCECPKCGYVCRTTSKWIEEAGAPICPTDERQMEVEESEDE